MSNNNLVKRWAEIINDYAEQAMDDLDGSASYMEAIKYVGAIQGCCAAIIEATTDTGEDC